MLFVGIDRRELALAQQNRVDVRHRAFRLLDLAQRHHKGIDELAEVILEERQVHEIVLHDECFRLVVGSYKNAVV